MIKRPSQKFLCDGRFLYNERSDLIVGKEQLFALDSCRLFLEFEEIHLSEACRQGYRTHVDEGENQKTDGDQ